MAKNFQHWKKNVNLKLRKYKKQGSCEIKDSSLGSKASETTKSKNTTQIFKGDKE